MGNTITDSEKYCYDPRHPERMQQSECDYEYCMNGHINEPRCAKFRQNASAQSSICSQAPQIVVSPTQTVPLSVAQNYGQMISAVPFMQAPNTQISPQVAYGQSLAGLPTQQIPNSYVLSTAGTRYQLAMGGAGNVVPAATRRAYGAPFPNC